jgi:hypothetical protein
MLAHQVSEYRLGVAARREQELERVEGLEREFAWETRREAFSVVA